jgi:hypothetical protein
MDHFLKKENIFEASEAQAIKDGRSLPTCPSYEKEFQGAHG